MIFRKNYRSLFFLPLLLFYFFSHSLGAQNNTASQDGLVGNVKSCETIYFYSSGSASWKEICEYEKSGRKIFQKEYNFPSLNWFDSTAFHFTVSGDTVWSFQFYKKKRKPVISTISVYDANGLIGGWKLYFKKRKKPDETKIYVYENKILVSDTFAILHGNTRGLTIEKYFSDSNNLVVRKEIQLIFKFDYSSELKRVEFSNDESGNDTLELRYTFNRLPASEFQLDTKTVRKFDQHGNVVAFMKIDHGITIEKYSIEYVYDDHGNWIKQTKTYDHFREDYPSISNDKKIVTTRKIEYY
jgi:hypothetical protein